MTNECAGINSDSAWSIQTDCCSNPDSNTDLEARTDSAALSLFGSEDKFTSEEEGFSIQEAPSEDSFEGLSRETSDDSSSSTQKEVTHKESKLKGRLEELKADLNKIVDNANDILTKSPAQRALEKQKHAFNKARESCLKAGDKKVVEAVYAKNSAGDYHQVVATVFKPPGSGLCHRLIVGNKATAPKIAVKLDSKIDGDALYIDLKEPAGG